MIGAYAGKDGEVQVTLETDRKTGLLHRPGTSDQLMLREAAYRDYSLLNCHGHKVLDLGANVGGFILKAASEKAESIISYEPEPNNFAVLTKNHFLMVDRFPGFDTTIVEAAVSDEDGEFDLVISHGSNSPCSASLVNKVRKNRHTVKVRVEGIKSVLERYPATMIKMDVEGAEYAILRDPLPAHVRELAIELHGFTKTNKALMYLTLEKLKKQGWTIVEQSSKKIFNVVSLITAYLKR